MSYPDGETPQALRRGPEGRTLLEDQEPRDMAVRALVVVEALCILCEEPAGTWEMVVDDDTGREWWRYGACPPDHDCSALKRLEKQRGGPTVPRSPTD